MTIPILDDNNALAARASLLKIYLSTESFGIQSLIEASAVGISKRIVFFLVALQSSAPLILVRLLPPSFDSTPPL